MWYALVKRDSEIVQLLLDNGADIPANGRDYNGRTVLHVALNRRWIKFFDAEHIFNKKLGIDIDTRENDGKRALWYACKHKRWDVAKALRERGANMQVINERDSKGRTLLHITTINYSLDDFLDFVQGLDIEIDAKDHRGRTALWYAAKN